MDIKITYGKCMGFYIIVPIEDEIDTIDSLLQLNSDEQTNTYIQDLSGNWIWTGR